MRIGFIGLGRMGHGMVERLLLHRKEVVVWNRTASKTKSIAGKGAIPAYNLNEFVGKLSSRKIIWLMLPAGRVTDGMIRQLLPLLKKGDIIVDGANDFYGNAEKHDKWCRKKGVHFFDCGVSGGVWGLQNGYTLMIGGPKSEFRHIEPFCKALSPKNGYGYFGPAGSGHYVKSVHNIIEYVYLEGLAEGVELLDDFNIDIKKAVSVWQPASVINSWLLDLTVKAVSRKDFGKIKPAIGSVTIDELIRTKNAVKGYAPAFDAAVKIRKDKSRKFALGKRTIAAVRKEFGGHEVEK
ncbi:TPA: NADP-dependent phosphogluconate dehydrogenase [Candidatus Woesearchaeota archaeon]|nr:6-phosphogluconate dehydrogenase [archaeon GW2011_AR15]MBS3103793.1 NADP-dependent phosphogluconate dehydrogenase [Candidatus Woesearchaeota archaeon]HIH41462.1 NADP-dependent phosphogluconate dehydrogenase [Candidatus Woesearchaeota archaeon]